jgi:hypothetical protein
MDGALSVLTRYAKKAAPVIKDRKEGEKFESEKVVAVYRTT